MPESSLLSISGNIVRVELEGGFWGIIASDGTRYVPIDHLETELLKNGLAVVAEIEPVTVFSTTMWGKHVRIHSIQRA